MILPTLVVSILGVSHLGNDRTGNPSFRGQTVGLQGVQMRIKLVRTSTTRCFSALFNQSWGCGCLVYLSAQWELRLAVYFSNR